VVAATRMGSSVLFHTVVCRLDAFVLKVASASDPGTVAGAIAGKV
jgi:hypothetical protein